MFVRYTTAVLHFVFRGYSTNLAAMANNLRRVSALHTEFGAFTSLKTLDQPRGRACWNMMKEGLVELEGYLHGEVSAGRGGGLDL